MGEEKEEEKLKNWWNMKGAERNQKNVAGEKKKDQKENERSKDS
jgi:hypothetical protein